MLHYTRNRSEKQGKRNKKMRKTTRMLARVSVTSSWSLIGVDVERQKRKQKQTNKEKAKKLRGVRNNTTLLACNNEKTNQKVTTILDLMYTYCYMRSLVIPKTKRISWTQLFVIRFSSLKLTELINCSTQSILR